MLGLVVTLGWWTAALLVGDPNDVDGDGVVTDRAGTLSLPGDSTVTGFTIANGRSSGDGGGIAQTSPGTFTVADCVIRNNEANRGGGIVAIGRAQPGVG